MPISPDLAAAHAVSKQMSYSEQMSPELVADHNSKAAVLVEPNL